MRIVWINMSQEVPRDVGNQMWQIATAEENDDIWRGFPKTSERDKAKKDTYNNG